MLFHYTSYEGFKAIVENRCLWHSDVRYLNDYQEVLFGKRLLADVYELAKEGPTVANCAVLERVIPSVVDIELTAFACSFSASPDLLSQWRGYSGGSGISLGFNALILEHHLGTPLTTIQYGEQQLTTRFHDALQMVASRGVESGSEDGLVKNFQTMIFSAKSAAFQEENEIRSVLTVEQALHHQHVKDPKVKYRTVGALLVPYVELSLGPVWDAVIQEIWIGPSRHGDLAWQSVREFADYHELGKVDVRKSGVPYRT